MALIRIDEPRVRPATPPRGCAVFALGFRPFYLLAAMLAVLAVPLWIAQYSGFIAMPAHVPGLYWHAHEMVFGFAVAVIVGFLFTAGQNWTGLPTPKDGPLAALCLLWLSGRFAMYLAPPLPAMVLDVVFLPVAALALGRVLWRARSRRNYFTVLLLLGLAFANIVFHLAAQGVLDADPRLPLHGALALIVVLTTVIAGRIVPSFTANALRIATTQKDWLEAAAIGLTGLTLALWIAGVSAWLVASLALVTALLQAARQIGWCSWATRRTPLLWILHLSHAWIIVGLLLIAVASFGRIAETLAWHAFGLGTVGGLILGMITRTALGHTGRMLVAGRIETVAYVLLHIGAVLRVLAPLVLPAAYLMLLGLAMLCWSSAFALYLYKYAPMLWKPRVDGKKG